MSIRLILKKFIPSDFRVRLKKILRRSKNNFLKSKVSKTTLSEMRRLLLRDFGITKGDNLIITSSFGNLNADFSPRELVELLKEIVGRDGNLVMPFYPPGNSYEWAGKGEVFDMQATRSSMGVLTQVFSELDDVYKSMHPTKAVVAWGKDAKQIVFGHEDSVTPFSKNTPYGWLMQNGSKSLGLGIKSNPMFHYCEDALLDKSEWLYFDKKFKLKVKNYHGEIIFVETFVHDPQKMEKLLTIGDYINKISPVSYSRVSIGFKYCYIIDNSDLFETCANQFKKSNFRTK